MELQISGWGNSLGIRIPKTVAEQLGVRSGSRLKASIESGKLIIKPKKKEDALAKLAAGIDLEKMVSKVTKKNRPSADEFEDTPVGMEVW